jgi:hypothetical protein
VTAGSKLQVVVANHEDEFIALDGVSRKLLA